MVRIETNKPKRGEFFKLRPDMRRPSPKGHGVVFENEDALLLPPRIVLKPEEGGFPPFSETPRLVYHPKEGVPPEDMEGMSGYWLVSERLRKVMEAVDPGAFVFAEIDYRLADGSQGPEYYLCDVIRTLDALDEEASVLNLVISDDYEGGKYYGMEGSLRLVFKRDVLDLAHVFRLPFHGGVFCDRVFKDAMKAAGILTPRKTNGLWFVDTVNC